MNTQKSVFNKISKIEREVESKEVELSEVQKVELAGEIEKFLRYYDGVESFGKNIDIDIEQIESFRRGLKVDMENLIDDMKLVQKGIDMAERAAQDLGINPNSIPNYDKAKLAISYGEKQLAKGKQFK